MGTTPLHNTESREQLLAKLAKETEPRTTLSFYRYTEIDSPESLRDDLYRALSSLSTLGRIYVAREGINAQVSVPSPHVDEFIKIVQQFFPEMTFRTALEETQVPSFLKLIVRVRPKIVQDGLDDSTIDLRRRGNHLTAKEFNKALEDGAVVVDMRNHYESRVGHFQNAILPQAETFREELPEVKDLLHDQKDQKILLYCTGGIRCEKASSYLLQHGFTDINQLQGGIIDYVRQINDEGLDCHFKGKNFVFDGRLGERVTDDILSVCDQCGKPSDIHRDCANDACHILMVQCDQCHESLRGACSPECFDVVKSEDESESKGHSGHAESVECQVHS